MRWRWTILAIGAAAAGCEVTPTQLLVVIDSDLDPELGEIDGFAVTVRGPDGQEVHLDRSTWSLDDVSLPASFAVAPIDGDADRSVEVEAAARLGGQSLFTTRAKTRFLEHELVRLDLFLAKRCRTEGVACEALGLTCDDGGCREPEIDPTDQEGTGRRPDTSPPEWVVGFASPAPVDPDIPDELRVALDSRGNAVVAGTYEGSVTIGGADYGNGATAAFVTAVPPDGGAPVWTTPLNALPLPEGDSPTLHVDGVAVDRATDRTYVVGFFSDRIEIGDGGPTEDAVGASDGFLVVLDAEGRHVDHATYGVLNADMYFHDVAVGPTGQVAFTGSFGYELRLGESDDLYFNHDQLGDIQSLFVAGWDGQTRWACSTPDAIGTGVALAADGTTRVAGTIRVADVERRFLWTVGPDDVEDQECRPSSNHSLGGSAGSDPRVALDPAGGEVWMSGILGAELDQRGEEMPGDFGFGDGLVVAFDGDDLYRWHRYLGNDFANDDLHGIVVNRVGTALVAGSITGGDAQVTGWLDPLPFGGGTSDALAAAFRADGTPLWARSFGVESTEHLSGIAYDEVTGAVILVGVCSGSPGTRRFGTEDVENGFMVYRFIP